MKRFMGIVAVMFGLTSVAQVNESSKNTCENLRLKVSVNERQELQGDDRTFSVSLENNGLGPVAIRRDKVASALRTERLVHGRWEVIGSTGIGRGVGSSSARPHIPTQDEAVKEALQAYVVLYPNEAFTVRTELNPLQLDTSERKVPRGRYRVSFVYADDMPEKAPVYSSTCELISNRVGLIANATRAHD